MATHSQARSVVRRAFTLVELLVTISVIAILSSLFLAAMYNAQETARAQKTRSTITKLHNLVVAKYESYKTRRVPVSTDGEPYTDSNGNGVWDSGEPLTDVNGNSTRDATLTAYYIAKLRLDALRELMRFEMPDRLSDIVDLATPTNAAAIASGIPYPSLAQIYFRRMQTAFASKLPGNPNLDPTKSAYKNQGAECLYMLVMYGLGEEESPRDHFHPSEIGDTDQNGLPEFLDGWGTPINFIRWPSAFSSELQTGDSVAQPDPFDPRRVYPTATPPVATYAIFPLIYSAGPDKIYDIKGNRDLDASPGPTSYVPKNNNPFDPVFITTGARIDENGDLVGLGNGEDNWSDNIHNHLIGTR